MRKISRQKPPTLFSSNQGFQLLSQMAASEDHNNHHMYKTTTTKPPPQPVMWFPSNNADCGGSTKGTITFQDIHTGS